MVTDLATLFPKLAAAGYRVTSDQSKKYNCIAWATANDQAWWEPGGGHPWPAGIPHDYTLHAYTQFFASLGFVPCDSAELEENFEKIALFVLHADEPQHAARQLRTGVWTSKLGDLEDIEHHLHDLEGAEYGRVVMLMKRPRPQTA